MVNSQAARELPKPTFFRIRDVQAYLNLSIASIYSLMDRDPTFPRSIKITKKAVAWRRSEIEEWARSRPHQPRKKSRTAAIGR